MKGKHKIEVRNNKIVFKLELERSITVIKGDSATGKTTLVELLGYYQNFGASSGVTVKCDKPCIVLSGSSWKLTIANTKDSIVFIDEGGNYVATEEFAGIIKDSDNYYVIITRENLYNLPISVDAIYGMKGRRYFQLKKTYNHLYRIYPQTQSKASEFSRWIVEDSNSGYQFFRAVAEEKGIECLSAGGNGKLLMLVKALSNEPQLLIADGASFGAYMEMADRYYRERQVHLFLPESFEWLILKSGLIDGNEVREILENPSGYIESSEYFSWERFFTALLVEKSKSTYLEYSKKKLNPAYLQEHEKTEILNQTPLGEQTGD